MRVLSDFDLKIGAFGAYFDISPSSTASDAAPSAPLLPAKQRLILCLLTWVRSHCVYSDFHTRLVMHEMHAFITYDPEGMLHHSS